MGYPGRHNIYAATIRRMVSEALERQELEFRKEHESDSNEQLLAYLRTCAFRLRHSPWPGEIIGGSYMEERFGTWFLALSLAKLPPPDTPNQPKTFARYQKEAEQQKIIYRQKKAIKKQNAQQRLREQKAKKEKRAMEKKKQSV